MPSATLIQLKQSALKNGPLLGVISAIGGFIADVLRPIAPFSEYLLYISLGLGLLAIIGYFYIARVRDYALTLLIFALLACGISALLLGLNDNPETKQKGVFATNITAVASLQNALGLIQQDLDTITANTETIKRDVASVDEKLEIVNEQVGEINTNLAAAVNTGGIIMQPTTQEDHYHNARLHELGGDYANARRSYVQYFANAKQQPSTPSQLDPHLRFQKFLKIQEGLAGAREIYQDQFGLSNDPIDQFALALLSPTASRRETLQNFGTQHPTFIKNFAPYYLEIARSYSAARLGTQTIADQRAELSNLQTFNAIANAGGLTRYFIDNEELDAMQSYANKRLTVLEAKASALKASVSFYPIRHNSGWFINLTINEPTTAIYYQTARDSAFVNAGLTGAVDPATGKPRPRTLIELPKHAAAQTIQVKYTDAREQMSAPIRYQFDPQTALIRNQIDNLNTTKSAWITTRDFDGDDLIYFTHLISYRCGISKVWYGINDDPTTTEFPLEPCDNTDPYRVTGENIVEPSRPLEKVTVKVRFADGTESSIQEFRHAP